MPSQNAVLIKNMGLPFPFRIVYSDDGPDPSNATIRNREIHGFVFILIGIELQIDLRLFLQITEISD